jgi:uncharacterized membrane protein
VSDYASADLIVIAFPEDEHRAEAVVKELRSLRAEQLVDLEDAVCVARDKHGHTRLHQCLPSHGGGARRGAFWGLLVGIVLSVPFPGLGVLAAAGLAAGSAVVGAGVGMLTSRREDFGIDDHFAKHVGDSLPPESSAIFALVREMSLDDVLPELAPFGGVLLQTTLSAEAQASLEAALAAHTEAGADAEDPGARTEGDSAAGTS